MLVCLTAVTVARAFLAAELPKTRSYLLCTRGHAPFSSEFNTWVRGRSAPPFRGSCDATRRRSSPLQRTARWALAHARIGALVSLNRCPTLQGDAPTKQSLSWKNTNSLLRSPINPKPSLVMTEHKSKTSSGPVSELISRDQLAKRWSISKETIKRREREGLLNPIRFNQRLLRYRLEDIVAVEQALLG